MDGTPRKASPERGGARLRRAEGFVSKRRDHNQAYRRRAHAQAEPTPKNRPNPNASRSSGERGLGGEALLSEKRPLPPEFAQFRAKNILCMEKKYDTISVGIDAGRP